MGTRNLTMVIDTNGEIKIAQYGQWDGCPSGQGSTILAFARDKEKLEKLKKELNNIKFFNKCEDINEYLEQYNEKAPEWSNQPDNRTNEDKYWFHSLITRDLGGKILEAVITLDKSMLPKEMNETIYLEDDSEFGKDSLMCEWAYCINLQTNKLQCFEGFNKDKSKEYPMFATNQEEVDKRFDYTDSRYYGIKLIKEYDLDTLPDRETFIKELEGEE